MKLNKNEKDNIENESYKNIIDAAGEIFAEVGFKEATTRNIAAKANVNVALINYYFGSKKSLFEAAILRYFNFIVNACPFRIEDLKDFEAEEKFHLYIELWIKRLRLLELPPWHTKLMLRLFGLKEVSLPKPILDFKRQELKILEEIISEIIPNSTRNNVQLCSHFISVLCRSISFLSDSIPKSLSNEELTEFLFKFSLAGIKSQI